MEPMMHVVIFIVGRTHKGMFLGEYVVVVG